MSVHFSSNTDQWPTPIEFFKKLDAEFNFQTDVCASRDNAKCETFFTEEDDGLSQEWAGTCWMNPPYGRAIKDWMRKAYESSLSGATVVCLVPARTDTAWWHDYAAKGEVRFVRGRLKFGEAKHGAPFPSAVVVFRPCKIIEVIEQ
jgi:phage N-6-adenine-methyltransferase